MKNTLIADTGYFAALANFRDKYHQLAINTKFPGFDLITTWPVITETCHYLVKRISPLAQSLFLQEIINQNIQLIALSHNQTIRMKELIEKYANLPMDLADASLVVLAEHLGLIWRVRLGDEWCYVYLLLEFQSTRR